MWDRTWICACDIRCIGKEVKYSDYEAKERTSSLSNGSPLWYFLFGNAFNDLCLLIQSNMASVRHIGLREHYVYCRKIHNGTL